MYRVYTSIVSYGNSIAGWEYLSTALSNWMMNTNTFSISDLNESTGYYFAVIVRDELGNKAIYEPLQVYTIVQRPLETMTMMGISIFYSQEILIMEELLVLVIFYPPCHFLLSSGFRQIAARGMIQNLTATLNLPNGNYYWSVQTIDTAFAGSEFASENFFPFFILVQ